MYGNELMVFPSTESAESSWCGDETRPCPDCSANDGTDICADRLVSSQMHFALTKLAKFVIAEWPQRK